MYLISKDEPLTVDRLGKIIQQFQTTKLPKLKKYYNYYIGKQDILNRQVNDESKPNNRVVVNYCHNIVKQFSGYIAGKPITYNNDDFDEVIDILKYNDYINEDVNWLINCLTYGVAYEINYIDEEGKQRFRLLDSREVIPVYDNTLSNDLVYAVRFYKEDLLDEYNENYIVEVYGQDKISIYKSTAGFSSFALQREEPHYYGQVPITVFKLNEDEESIFGQIMSLQDCYNSLVSDSTNNADYFQDAYLVLKGCVADDDAIATMKTNRVLMMDPDASAEFLTKNVSDLQMQDMLKNINDQIFRISNAPDFNDQKFFADSGISLRYHLVQFENTASGIEQNMRKALQRRIELISAIINITDEKSWRDCNIEFHRNLPTNIEEIVSYCNQLRGLISTESILRLLPMVDDVDEELKRLQEEKEKNQALYFSDRDEETDDEE